ncbi:hypothetical protein GCM10008941_18450 [Rhizomicrobium palustre]
MLPQRLKKSLRDAVKQQAPAQIADYPNRDMAKNAKGRSRPPAFAYLCIGETYSS